MKHLFIDNTIENQDKKKELLNGKPVSQKEKVKKDISDKPLMVMSRILSIVAVVLFFTGAIFLLFARDHSNSADGDLYLWAAFNGNVAALLTIIFGFVFYMFTIIQLVLNFKNKPSYKKIIHNYANAICNGISKACQNGMGIARLIKNQSV